MIKFQQSQALTSHFENFWSIVQLSAYFFIAARSDMMCAMFSHEEIFKEASARVIQFPGINRLTFYQLLFYLYTDQSPSVTTENCVDLIELANRLCLPRLVTLVEDSVIKSLTIAIENGQDVCEDALTILQPCQVLVIWII